MSVDGPEQEGPRDGHPAPWRPPRRETPETRSAETRSADTGSAASWASPGGTTGHWSAPAAGWGQEGQAGVGTTWAPPGGPWPPPGSGPTRPTRTRGRTIAVVVIVVGLVVVVVAVVAATLGQRFWGTNVLDRPAVERGVAQILTQDWKRRVDGVQCPADEPARPGNSFTCRATVDGKPQQVPVDVLDERGLYQVGQPR